MAKTPDFQFQKSQELKYALQLRKVADQSGAIVDSHINEDGELEDIEEMVRTAALYSEALEPWANRVVAAMISSVAKSNERSWRKNSEMISRGLSELMSTSRISPVIKAIQQEQVFYIKSIPVEAAERAKDLSVEAVLGGKRADEVAILIQDTTNVTKARATMLARTGIASTNAGITEARAGLIGSTEYKWRTMEDGRVRESHEEMADKVFRFDSPPAVEGEGNHGPGDWPNCRCYAEPII